MDSDEESAPAPTPASTPSSTTAAAAGEAAAAPVVEDSGANRPGKYQCIHCDNVRSGHEQRMRKHLFNVKKCNFKDSDAAKCSTAPEVVDWMKQFKPSRGQQSHFSSSSSAQLNVSFVCGFVCVSVTSRFERSSCAVCMLLLRAWQVFSFLTSTD
jgi:hypothetical protein